MQNTSHAVMAQRKSSESEPDDFPTPPWATRALMKYYFHANEKYPMTNVWEPACNRGFMSKVLKEYFKEVYSTDLYEYGYGGQMDFLNHGMSYKKPDYIITNPPFKLAEQFADQATRLARKGVALLVRTSFLEGVGRYNRLFKDRQPTSVVQFSERVPMVKGRCDPKASTATSYCWLVWQFHKDIFPSHTELMWIPPCRKELEKEGDYDL